MIKKKLAILMVLILSTIATASAETMNQNQNTGEFGIPTETRVVDLGNGIMMYDMVHHVKDSVSLSGFGIVSIYKPYDFKLMGVQWASAEPFEVNLGTFGIDEIQASFNTWDEITQFIIFGAVTESSVIRGEASDTVNSVTMEYLGDGGTIAFARIWAVNGYIYESDVVFNSYYDWSDSGVSESGKMDLQNIATHEFGHSAGLLDLYSRRSYFNTMYGRSNYGDIEKQTLTFGDIAGIQAIYG